MVKDSGNSGNRQECPIRYCITAPTLNQFSFEQMFTEHDISVSSIRDEIHNMFELAEENIKICSPFLEWNGLRNYIDVLIRKARSGVEISILIREILAKPDSNRSQGIKKSLEIFRKNQILHKIKIRDYYIAPGNKLKSSIHAKFLIVDDSHAYIGSADIRENALTKNFELGLIVENADFVYPLVCLFDEMYMAAKNYGVGLNDF